MVSKGTPEEKLTILFKTYDKDDSGELDKAEVNAIMDQMRVVAKSLGRDPEKAEDFAKAILAKLDADGSGQISLQEWLTVGAKTPSLLTLLGA
jgi:Ca2+-binding EF-hand superfamily protein